MKYWPDKDPSDVLDYSMDWSAVLGADTIATSTWTVPDGLTVGITSHNDTTSTIWLSGGTANTGYTIANLITTAGGRTIEQSVRLIVREL